MVGDINRCYKGIKPQKPVGNLNWMEIWTGTIYRYWCYIDRVVSDRNWPSDAWEPSALAHRWTTGPTHHSCFAIRALAEPDAGAKSSAGSPSWKRGFVSYAVCADPISHWPHIRTALQTTCYPMSTLISTYLSSVQWLPQHLCCSLACSWELLWQQLLAWPPGVSAKAFSISKITNPVAAFLHLPESLRLLTRLCSSIESCGCRQVIGVLVLGALGALKLCSALFSLSQSLVGYQQLVLVSTVIPCDFKLFTLITIKYSFHRPPLCHFQHLSFLPPFKNQASARESISVSLSHRSSSEIHILSSICSCHNCSEGGLLFSWL